ncbi:MULTISPECIES: LysR family transcriptional regulator [Shewanella]|uniref:LysR family transcriptional regulator n=1 Tax=Shewanella TaxID=22 RepID=UPI001C657BBE|nr:MULTISPECIES: LysR family transcriptional regulator [Shewanella]QYJ75202.1 LysR family transcriptional regulator [Shewanella sp. FJAT-52076]QYK05075.1 LysR family transcriptional regulator [Shewanella zhangzhouensis]
MQLDKLTRIDLNLLVVLQVLLEEQSVTRAAVRLNLSQSALSKSLSRLRETLGDPLFSRTAHGLKPTAHALALAERLPGVLQALNQLVMPPSFDPASSTRTFSFAMVESAYETLIPGFIGPLLSMAPGLRLNSYVWNEKSISDLQLGQIDFGIDGIDLQPEANFRIDSLPEGICHQTLYQDQQICLVRQGHPAMALLGEGKWDLNTYLELAHVQVRCEGNDWWALDYYLATQGKQRHLCATVPDFYGAASVCANTDLVFTLPQSFARHASKLYALEMLPLPFDFMPLAYVLLWHQRNDGDPGHRWIRELIIQSARKSFGEKLKWTQD